MERIINYFIKNYGFKSYHISSSVRTLIKDDIHVYLYMNKNKILYNNLIFENIITVKDLKFVYFNYKGTGEIGNYEPENNKELIVERNENDINILKYN